MFRKLLKSVAPLKLKATLDYYFRPHLLAGFGGPFNGQCGRQQLFIDLVRTFNFTHIFETGAFRGTTTEFMAIESGLPTYSVESDSERYYYSRLRLARTSNAHVECCDSRSFLTNLAMQLSCEFCRPFVYLDAHQHPGVPLREELAIVLSSFQWAIIMVDDFQVMHDAGYGFDCYGDGKTLDLKYLDSIVVD